MVLIFVPEHVPDHGIFYNEEIAEMSRTLATFVRIDDSGYRPRGANSNDSTVPVSPLAGNNLPGDYRVAPNRITVVICDWWGNDWGRTTERVSPANLRRMIGQVENRVESEERRLQSMLDRARQAVDERNDDRAAMAELMRMFRTEKYGFDAMYDAGNLYHDICDRARRKLNELVAEGDLAGVRALGLQFRDTDFYQEIERAIEILSARVANAR